MIFMHAICHMAFVSCIFFLENNHFNEKSLSNVLTQFMKIFLSFFSSPLHVDSLQCRYANKAIALVVPIGSPLI